MSFFSSSLKSAISDSSFPFISIIEDLFFFATSVASCNKFMLLVSSSILATYIIGLSVKRNRFLIIGSSFVLLSNERAARPSFICCKRFVKTSSANLPSGLFALISLTFFSRLLSIVFISARINSVFIISISSKGLTLFST